jgi:hypothetical protein
LVVRIVSKIVRRKRSKRCAKNFGPLVSDITGD